MTSHLSPWCVYRIEASLGTSPAHTERRDFKRHDGSPCGREHNVFSAGSPALCSPIREDFTATSHPSILLEPREKY